MNKHKQRKLRQHRVRAKVSGTAAKPRLNVFRSLKSIYAQLIDDELGRTLVAASSKDVKRQGKKNDIAAEVGKLIAAKALEAGIKQVTFDRAGYKYHGRVKSLAEAARSAGLTF
ncbi:MAG: 50S ribosomal protein L18 [Candidatus Doudnabacteria bacterium]|nr:50S ribosomal protein L18 [Candidatus Doudnabacteria bacterium]